MTRCQIRIFAPNRSLMTVLNTIKMNRPDGNYSLVILSARVLILNVYLGRNILLGKTNSSSV